jgi:WD40 repeat protein
VVGGHHELTVWDATKGTLQKRVFTRAERAYAMLFLPDGTLAVAGSRPGQEGDVRVFDLNAKPTKSEGGVDYLDGVKDPKVMLKQLHEADDSVLCLALSADGKKLAAGGCDRAVRVWDIAGGVKDAKLEQTVENHADWVLGVAFTSDGKFLLSGSRDKTAKVWDLKAKESVMTFPDHQSIVYAVGAKADGSIGYSVGADKQVRTWKPGGDGKQVKNAGAHADEVFKVAVSKDGLLATASADKSLKVWNGDGLAATKTLTGLSDWVYAVAWSADGTKVAGGAYNGEVAIWDAKDKNDKPLAQFNATPGLPKK